MPASCVDHTVTVTNRRLPDSPISGPPTSASGSQRGQALAGAAAQAVEGSELGSKCCCRDVRSVVSGDRHQPPQTIGSASEVDQCSPKRFRGQFVLRRWRVGPSEHVFRGTTAVPQNQVGTLVADDGQLLMPGGAGRIEQNTTWAPLVVIRASEIPPAGRRGFGTASMTMPRRDSSRSRNRRPLKRRPLSPSWHRSLRDSSNGFMCPGCVGR